MTITDYFNDYKKKSKFPFCFNSSDSPSIDDFYNNCIHDIYKNSSIVNNLLAWHEMLVKYSAAPKNILWVRQYESGIKDINDNRRASLVEFSDGFKILYVSNYDAQEIFNMAITGVSPDLAEFKDLIDKHDYYFHYSNSCGEKNTNSFPNCINAKSGGVLTKANYYLAHIRSVNEVPYFVKGKVYDTSRKGDEKLHDKLYPYGKQRDYNIGGSVQKDRVFKQGYSLNCDEKIIIRAHFLRFVDPLNYFPVPGTNNHLYEYNSSSPKYRNIGEFPLLISYMYDKMKGIYKTVNYADFDKLTCFNNSVLPANNPLTIVNVAVRAPKSYSLRVKGIRATGKAKRSTPVTRSTVSLTTVNTKRATSTTKAAKTSKASKVASVGQYAKSTFTNLLVDGKLTSQQINNLTDKSYCRKTFGISFPILVVKLSGSYNAERYYKNHIVCGKYLICSQWYEKNRDRIQAWLSANGL